ncbi:hypothetical protein LJC63_01950 [Ruminococcaceae bacterium OttesenSCG-928-L11]|nr:hypothetical protein [Ruminococcaceae bacterium OttesenSCG-928-L11]
MPIIRNYLQIRGAASEIEAALHFIQNDATGIGSIDFNKIEPMPPWIFQGELSPEAEKRYGAEHCWKRWCLAHWGCARNALFPERSTEEYDGGDTILFFTEDSDVRELMRKLSLVFKIPCFDYMWADEETGKSAGLISFRDGVASVKFLPKAYSREAYELAFDTFGTSAGEHGLVPDSGTYIYRKEEENDESDSENP